MNWWAAVGSLSLGLMMGWFFRHSLERFKQYTVVTMSGSISVVLGAVVVGALGHFGGNPKPQNELWLYPVGLLLGVVVTSAWYLRGEL